MKKPVVYRTLQIASAIAVYAITSVWASENHVDVVSNTITSINSLLVILAIAVVFPYICFKALGKIYTPPASRFREENVLDQESELSQDEIKVIKIEQIVKPMQYRGTRYSPEDLDIKSTNITNENNNTSTKPKERMKYRGSYID